MEADTKPQRRRGIYGATLLAVVAAAGATAFVFFGRDAKAGDPPAAPVATPVSVALVQPRELTPWDDFSGRLQAVDRVEIRSRVAGTVLATHFREGALVKKGDLLVSIDPDPYQAEVQRALAQVSAAEARVAFTHTELERGQKLVTTRVVSQSEVDQRTNAYNEAEANLKAAQAALRSAQLNLGYTQVRAPVSGRVGRIEITTGNLVAAGPTAPVLTTLVSVDPIYVAFDADEGAVSRALASVGGDRTQITRIPVDITTATAPGRTWHGHLQFVDNQVEPGSGTLRVRAVFANADGALTPGQFARVRLGRAKAEEAIAISERAIGTDQDKKYVMVVSADNKATYRQIEIGRSLDGLRVVTAGLKSGDRIVVNGLQHVRPGSLLAPELVSMNGRSTAQTDTAAEVTAR